MSRGQLRTGNPVPLLLSFLLLFLLLVGCPHRSPLWSPDGTRLLVLGGADGEPIDKPASRLWLITLKGEGGKGPGVRRFQNPEGEEGGRYLAAAWIDGGSFALLTTRWKNDEAIEGSEAVWTVSAAEPATAWRKVGGPPPSIERTPRRNPLVILAAGKDGGKEARRPALVYPTSSEAVAVVSLEDGKEIAHLEPAELVGPGPGGGFIIYRPEAGGTGGLEIASFGSDLKPLWSRKFSDLAAEIGKRIGKRRDEVVFNDISTSNRVAGKDQVGVNLVYTDVNWQQGVSGFHAVLAAADGALVTAGGATCLPGMPLESRDAGDGLWAWAVAPSSKAGEKTPALRSFPLPGTGGEERAAAEVPLDLKGASRNALHGYALSPDRGTIGVVINGPATRLLLYPVEGGKMKGGPVEVELR